MASESSKRCVFAVDTATGRGSAALTRGAELIAVRAWGGTNESHSRQILTQIDLLLTEAGVSLDEVDLFAASTGPGSFTGLRIGLATVKSFAATLDKPCAGVPTLAAVARAAGPSSHTLCCLAAGRGEVFCQLYEVAADLTVTELSSPTHLTLPELLAWAWQSARPLRWAGPVVDVYAQQIIEFAQQRNLQASGAENAEWVLAQAGERALAPEVAALAATDGRAVRADELRALYVRRAEAEIKKEVSSKS